ncbi:alpha/beta fold hydrolase [Pseudanabaena sp. FACHB-2040]|uniref:YheT family hydrolase n=1 Tax=Pseudanabaena sp. FACHB-2040 TaxID=2692859 RepID=UPI001688B43F|nr:alpha/beta fold hydrolase [Pseudanabaena sp. FACHB-2040]MBD2259014.1 alpha/beta fold hydrolase [Pseudanabaena sp. FACHB-2040]
MPPFLPPWFLSNGVLMTVYVARIANHLWQRYTLDPEPIYQSHRFTGAGDVPLFGITATPNQPKGTIIGTYGITGDLEDQWFLRILGRKAFAHQYAVLLFDWRAHGKTAELSPTLTSDGIYEGDDFVHLAAQAKALGCPPPFWFTGFSLGGQLALWGIKAASALAPSLGLAADDIGGGAVICPSLDSARSLQYLMAHPVGRYLERAIANQLQILAQKIQTYHPQALDPEAIRRADSIWGFDQELVIPRLGFETVEDYYAASSPLPLLPHLQKPTLILYAADDPLFDPTLVKDLETACSGNPVIDLRLTQHGGHVGYISSRRGQQLAQDPDPWWAWNRVLEWIESGPKP